ncbi:MAG: class I SAM-dependent methyltransferase [Rhodospirillaceae bacterium]|nr:class I SAM-dependent methyltransferase [Rhodospirillaceae bacterium]
MGTRLRRCIGGLSTVLGFAARGFYIPLRGAGDVSPLSYPNIEAALRGRETSFRDALAVIDRHAAALVAIAEGLPDPAARPARFDQDWFPRLDAALAYSFVREFMPRRIVEIGSGHSTRFMARAIRDQGLSTRLTAIDPAPRAQLEGLKIEHRHVPVQTLGVEPFAALAAGDFVFIDSSHVLMPGTDVDFLLNIVLPMLPAGVLVHFHDIFLPNAYPDDWQWRGYNEQNAVAMLVLSPAYEVVAASHYMAAFLGAEIAASTVGTLPLRVGASETSLWLRKVVSPTHPAT